MPTDSLGYSIAIFSIGLAVAIWAAVRWPKREWPPDDPDPADASELRKEYKRWDGYHRVAFVLFLLSLSSILSSVLVALAPLVTVKPPADAYALLPPRIFWFYGAAFTIAMAPASILSEVVIEFALGDRVDAYRRYARRQYGRLADASNKGIVLYSSLAGSLVMALAVNWYAFFTPDGIVLNSFFRLHEEKFAYTEVTRIRSASTHTRRPSGKLRYLVDFQNGRSWNSNSLLVDDHEKVDAIARYVSDRSGMSIEPVQDF